MSTKRMNPPTHQSAPSKNCWRLTEQRMERLELLAAEGVPLAVAARELGTSPRTLQNAADREGKTEWLREKFPRRQGVGSGKNRAGKEITSKLDGRVRKLKPEDIQAPLTIPSNPQSKWLTKTWRAA